MRIVYAMMLLLFLMPMKSSGESITLSQKMGDRSFFASLLSKKSILTTRPEGLFVAKPQFISGGKQLLIYYAGIGSLSPAKITTNYVEIWDVITRKQERVIKFPDKVNDLDSSAWNSFLVTGNDDGEIAVWNTTLGKKIRTIKDAHLGGVSRIKFISNGKVFISIGTKDQKIKKWDLATGKQLAIWQMPGELNPYCIGISANSDIFAVAYGMRENKGGVLSFRTVIKIYSEKNIELEEELKLAGFVTSIAFSNDPKTLFVGMQFLRLQKKDTLGLIAAFTQEGQYVLSREKKLTYAPYSVAILPSGVVGVTGKRSDTQKGILECFNSTTFDLLCTEDTGDNWILKMVASPDKQMLVVCGLKQIRLIKITEDFSKLMERRRASCVKRDD